MHDQDGKPGRAGAERIEVMEVCPVCGEQRRNSARFCTTCGHRFVTDELANTPVAPVSHATDLVPQGDADPLISGWPAPVPQASQSPWAPPAGDKGGWPAPPVDAASSTGASEVTWAEIAATALGSQKHARPATVAPAESDQVDEFDAIDDLPPEAVQPPGTDGELLRQRARALLGELREVIEGLTGETSTLQDDLASELEISLTRPAALEGEALADLRAAAEAAQDRPRDLDTLTALTAQAETILALIVGYERATAGIERAIDTLRGSSRSPEDE